MKILIGKLGAESNAFATEICNMHRYAPHGITCGEDIFKVYKGTPDYLGGMIKAGEEEGVEIFPSIGSLSPSSALIRVDLPVPFSPTIHR